MELGSFIRERRQAAAVSLRALAQAVGCDVAYLSRVETGKVAPSDEILGKLAAALSCDDGELRLLAGRLPNRLREALAKRPHAAAIALREQLGWTGDDAISIVRPPRVRAGEPRAIDDGFPFEEISVIAEAESWRKEVYRPVYHLHKWWAQRLGSVFRAAILAAALPRGESVLDYFYRPVRLDGLTVFDPFMGSGTTVGEAHKLGCTAIGRDINPVAYHLVRTALGPIDREQLARHFDCLSRTVAPKLQRLYRSTDRRGQPCDVLYYFWVKMLDCPACGTAVDLFPRYVFTRHAMSRTAPVHCLCPDCGAVFAIGAQDRRARCPQCKRAFDPLAGPARRTTAVCRACTHEFPLAATARAAGRPPAHRLYAKLVLRQNGEKVYLPVTPDDLAAYERASAQLHSSGLPIPRVPIEAGYNTKQILNYGYRYWHELFNDRQLVALGTLAQGIRELPAGPERDVLALLFSGVLEFNNMFASYKGEGTGAVRHMFSHHVLKPERMPIEANVWGTPASSGAFSTLYRSRVLRAIHYREAPFEVAVAHDGRAARGSKVFGLSPPMGGRVYDRWPSAGLPPGALYLACGDSAQTDLPDASVDLVVTDPPFFDNVHYSELADFFHVWQETLFDRRGGKTNGTTRAVAEVQDTDPAAFAAKLRAVFTECCRVLRDDGRLVFSYHHSREEGWTALANAIAGAGFALIQSQPVKAEMSVAAPKSQAKEPIDLDVLLVCVKRARDTRQRAKPAAALAAAQRSAAERVARFNSVGRRLSRGDVRVVLLSQLLVELSAGRDARDLEDSFAALVSDAQAVVETLWESQAIDIRAATTPQRESRQLALFSDAEQS